MELIILTDSFIVMGRVLIDHTDWDLCVSGVFTNRRLISVDVVSTGVATNGIFRRPDGSLCCPFRPGSSATPMTRGDSFVFPAGSIRIAI